MRRHGEPAAALLLLLAPVIWGVSFPAWKAIYDHLDVWDTLFWVRASGALALVPIVLLRPASRRALRRPLLGPALLLGAILAVPSVVQAVGLERTTASSAALITVAYVVATPLVVAALARTRPVGADVGIAAVAVGGVALIAADGLGLRTGDALVAASALGWAVHIVALGRLAPRHDPFALTFGMAAVSAVIHLVVALPGGLDVAGASAAAWPLLVAGPGATAVAYGIQIVAQRRVTPARTAVILAGEALFAAAASALWLGERLDARQWLGAAIVLGAMAVSEGRALRRTPTIPA